ncbi:MAG: branched-chain amino acid aminotransferase [Alphaproteobacteria bacterium]|nr:branched-chain amino acid aminotransferase [Alphaproteobacteria bacterium]
MDPLHYIAGRWVSGNPPIVGPMSHAIWMASCVFDGARIFEGTQPDMDRHCARVVASAGKMGLEPKIDAATIAGLVREGAKRFSLDVALYVRPMFYADTGFVSPDPASTQFVLTLFPAPMPSADGMAVCRATVRRPAADMAPTDAKAACLYPNAARGLRDAAARGFQNAVVLDGIGNVAELLTANLFLVKGGVAITPIANGTFLAGITRRRVMQLLKDAGVPMEERVVSWDEVLAADELLAVGNYGKVQPITRIEDRHLQPGPVFRKARALYWEFAHASKP